MTEGLAAGAAITEPGSFVDLPLRWVNDEWKAEPLSWSRKREDRGESATSAGDTRTARSDEPRYQRDEDRAAADGVHWQDQCLVCLGVNAD